MKRKGSGFILAGLLLIAAALLLTGYNLWEENRAADAAVEVTQQLVEMIPQVTEPEIPAEEIVPETPLYVTYPEMEMPAAKIDSDLYIGILEIPALDLELPIMSSWSYPKLKVAPCRYTGSAYTKDLVIAAHNYKSHFGRLGNLALGDRITFTDVDGNVFTYEVAAQETLMPTAIREMTSGEWALTLFTCTVGGSYRVAVRCDLVE